MFIKYEVYCKTTLTAVRINLLWMCITVEVLSSLSDERTIAGLQTHHHNTVSLLSEK